MTLIELENGNLIDALQLQVIGSMLNDSSFTEADVCECHDLTEEDLEVIRKAL